VLLAGLPAIADVIHLKNGRTIWADQVREKKDRVEYDLGEDTYAIPKSSVERIDAGTAQGLVPGVDPEATPACVNACISSALAFGDIDDPDSNVSRLLAQNQHFRMHEELGTGPGFFYLWD